MNIYLNMNLGKYESMLYLLMLNSFFLKVVKLNGLKIEIR